MKTYGLAATCIFKRVLPVSWDLLWPIDEARSGCHTRVMLFIAAMNRGRTRGETLKKLFPISGFETKRY